jgi:hypothetical protein
MRSRGTGKWPCHEALFFKFIGLITKPTRHHRAVRRIKITSRPFVLARFLSAQSDLLETGIIRHFFQRPTHRANSATKMAINNNPIVVKPPKGHFILAGKTFPRVKWWKKRNMRLLYFYMITLILTNTANGFDNSMM